MGVAISCIKGPQTTYTLRYGYLNLFKFKSNKILNS